MIFCASLSFYGVDGKRILFLTKALRAACALEGWETRREATKAIGKVTLIEGMQIDEGYLFLRVLVGHLGWIRKVLFIQIRKARMKVKVPRCRCELSDLFEARNSVCALCVVVVAMLVK